MKLELEIEELNKMLIKMANLVVENLKIAFDIYYKYDEAKADLINDDLVDLHERLIEESCLNIMLRERPYAKDLRIVSGVLKLVGDLERLGDHAEDIRDFARKLNNCEHHEIEKLDDAIDITLKMVNDSVLSYVNKNLELAQEVIKTDDIVDRLYEECLKIIIDNDKKDYSSEFSVYTTLVVKYIERVADHAVNVCEWVVYMLSGYYKDKQIF